MLSHVGGISTSNPADVVKNQRNQWSINRLVRASAELDLAAKVLMEAIVDHAGGGPGVCTASAPTLAKETTVCLRHVKNVLNTPGGDRLDCGGAA